MRHELNLNQTNTMKHIIIGIRGQIGACIHTYLLNIGEGNLSGIEVGDVVVSGEYMIECVHGDVFDLMHVCIPFLDAESFYKDVSYYIKNYPSKYVVIYSTVLPGTSERLGENVVHSPVEGRHPKLIEGFKTFKRLVGGKCSDVVGGYFKNWGLNVDTYVDAKVTELGKLLSTERYGINLVFAAEEEGLCERFGVMYEDVVLGYQRMYNEGYKKLGEERFVQPLLTAPQKKIFGHCVVPNSRLLSTISNSELIKMLSEFNDDKN